MSDLHRLPGFCNAGASVDLSTLRRSTSGGTGQRGAAIKLQVTGPVTLAAALERAAGRTGQGRSVRALAFDIALWLAANAAGQVRALAERGIEALLLVDEPGLAHAGLDDVHLLAPDDATTVAARIRTCLASVSAPERSLLTPSCGTGRLSPERERLVAAVLGAAAATTQGSDPITTGGNQGVRPHHYRR